MRKVNEIVSDKEPKTGNVLPEPKTFDGAFDVDNRYPQRIPVEISRLLAQYPADTVIKMGWYTIRLTPSEDPDSSHFSGGLSV